MMKLFNNNEPDKKSIEWNNNTMVKLCGKIFNLNSVGKNNILFIKKENIKGFMQWENLPGTIVLFTENIKYGEDTISNIEIAAPIEEIYKLFSLEEKEKYIMITGNLYNVDGTLKFLIQKEDISCILQPDYFVQKETIVFLKKCFLFNNYNYNYIFKKGNVDINFNIFGST